jgi:hyperosmotically inducible protein
MNSQSTSRIVIGAAMAVVVAVGATMFTMRAHQQTEVAQAKAASPEAQTPLGPTASEPTFTDQPAAAPAPVPADSAPVAQSSPPVDAPAEVPANDQKQAAAKSKSERKAAKAHSNDDSSGTRVASAAADVPQAPPGQPSMSTEATTTVTSDSQITTEVKSQISSESPGNSVQVTTSNGVVALAGSVPDQDAITQAKQAAERVKDVRAVDTSGLTVSNN